MTSRYHRRFVRGDEPRPQNAPAERPERDLDRRMREQTLPCCGPDGCTGGPSCWHDEPDNIPEDDS